MTCSVTLPLTRFYLLLFNPESILKMFTRVKWSQSETLSKLNMGDMMLG